MNYGSNYNRVHKWLAYNFGKADRCEGISCTQESSSYEWAKKQGVKYEKKLDNFIKLCASCHRKYDLTPNSHLSISKSVIAEKNGNVLRFRSISDAARSLGMVKGSILNNLSGRSKLAGGYRWSYENN